MSNTKTAFLIKFDAYEKTFLNSISLLINDIKEFDRSEGKLKIQILENKNQFPDESALIIEFEKNLSEFDLKFNNYQLAKMKIDFPRKLKYTKEGFFIVMEYIAPKSKYILYEAGVDNIYWFYPKENKWKYIDNTKGFYYTLYIIK